MNDDKDFLKIYYEFMAFHLALIGIVGVLEFIMGMGEYYAPSILNEIQASMSIFFMLLLCFLLIFKIHRLINRIIKYIKFKYISFFLLLCIPLSADVVRVPDEACLDIKSASYSTGGGKKAMIYIKLLCEDINGNTALFMRAKVSVSGALGWSRFMIPKKIQFIRDKGLTDQIQWGRRK